MADNENTIVLTDEEGNSFEFLVVDVLEVEDNEYVILLPADMDDDDTDALVLKVGRDKDGSEVLFEIEDEAEWEKVTQTWEEAIAGEDNY
ncbi:MAG: DUF1292 domain-containing protein [Clostridia bacterium]|nr:DUF1292 domain-containing protein [Clostridia bacterium]